MISFALLAAAAVVLLAPWAGRPASFLWKPAAAAGGAAVGFQAAIADLAIVRRRLAETGHLTDAERKAIDALTLALVAGSDK